MSFLLSMWEDVEHVFALGHQNDIIGKYLGSDVAVLHFNEPRSHMEGHKHHGERASLRDAADA